MRCDHGAQWQLLSLHELRVNKRLQLARLSFVHNRMRVMNLTTGESGKGWMGEFNKTLPSRMMDRTRGRGVAEW